MVVVDQGFATLNLVHPIFLEFKFQPQDAWGFPSNKSRNKYFLSERLRENHAKHSRS